MPDLPTQLTTITKATGGIAQSSKSGAQNSFGFGRSLDIYSDEDSISLLPKPIKDSGNTVTDLVMAMQNCLPYTTSRYAYGNAGNIYKIDNNSWVLDRTVSIGSAAGQGLGLFQDQLVYATSTTLGIKQYLSSGGTYNDDYFSDGTQNVDVSQSKSGQTYTTLTSISEAAADTLTLSGALAFTKDPVKAILITLTSKGTGSVTVTLHDSLNNSLGAVTIANGSLVNGSNTFTFTTPVRIVIGRTYHLHVTSSTGDATVQTGTASNINAANFSTLFGILIADTNYHNMIMHTNGTGPMLVIGNERYLATWDGITYNPNKIALEPGYVVRGFTKVNEFILAYCWKGTSTTGSEYGRFYYWDGIQNYFNYYKEVTAGIPNTVLNHKQRVFSIVNTNGMLALDDEPMRTVQKAPKLTVGSTVEVLPNASAIWENKAFFGYSNTNDSNAGSYTPGTNPPTGIEQGVYVFGNLSDRSITYTSVSTETLNFAFQPSTAIANPTNFKIGCIAPFGVDLYISYKDGTSYYVDRVNKANGPVGNGSYESLVIDEGIDKNGQPSSMPAKSKRALGLTLTYLPLPTGCTLTPKYRIARTGGNWVFGTGNEIGSAGSTSSSMLIGSIGGVSYKEIEVGFDVTATSNYPIITGIIFAWRPLTDERDTT